MKEVVGYSAVSVPYIQCDLVQANLRSFVALRCADSITNILSLVHEFHITVLYSKMDLARVMKAFVLIFSGASNPSVRIINNNRWLDFFS